MISVDEALAALLDLVAPLPAEDVPLRQVAGRVQAGPLLALHDQPPFAASAMDGYAVAGDEITMGTTLALIGEAAAGHPFGGSIGPGEAVRIFTGAPAPEGTRRILLQEDVTRANERITITQAPGEGAHLRAPGGDFRVGYRIAGGKRLNSRDVALIAAMGHGTVPCIRRPEVAIAMTGDELVPPGTPPPAGRITASNGYGLAAMVEAAGATARLLPIARDRAGSLREALSLAGGADLIVTIGGASVGDHDLVADVARGLGLELSFHKVRMRPGKPLLAGRLGDAALVGLPGNPVSSMVCGTLFILPMLRKMLGLPVATAEHLRPLGAAVTANGPRQHYQRATLANGTVQVALRQDSSLLGVLATADILVVRPPHDPPRDVGEMMRTIDLPA